MAIKYIVNGGNALKPIDSVEPVRLSLVSDAQVSTSSDRMLGLFNKFEVAPHCCTEVDEMLDNFQGTAFVERRSDKLFCVAACIIGALALFGFTILSAL